MRNIAYGCGIVGVTIAAYAAFGTERLGIGAQDVWRPITLGLLGVAVTMLGGILAAASPR
jgi:hypothetical protein